MNNKIIKIDYVVKLYFEGYSVKESLEKVLAESLEDINSEDLMLFKRKTQ